MQYINNYLDSMYEKLTELLTFSIDKYMHFTLAAVFACVMKMVLLLFLNPLWCVVISVAATIVLCIAKEIIFDKAMKRGTPEWKDLWFGVAGALIGAL